MTTHQRVRGILAGQVATFRSDDGTGWIRRPAPCNGLLVEDDETTLLVPLEEAEREIAAMRAVVDRQQKRKGKR